ncbi:MAG: lipid A export permease/ATP-binding protein MsbA [Gammaproteobacteria bacterium]|nr:lipid A export permease/ATP-binding protein MsbA [Gammaproteobacteria bacterium]
MNLAHGSGQTPPGARLYRRLLAYAAPFPGSIALAVLGFILFALTTPWLAWWFGWLTDAISSDNAAELRGFAVLNCLAIPLVRGVGGFLGGYSMAQIASQVTHRLRSLLSERLVLLPARFFDGKEPGKLVSKFSYDVSQVTEACSSAFAIVVREGLIVLGLLAYLLYIDWRLGLLFLIIAPLVGVVVRAASSRFRRYSKQMQDSMGDVSQIILETVKGYQVVRIFNAESYVNRKLRDASERNRRQNMKIAMTLGISTPLVQFIVAMAMAALVWLALSPAFFTDKTPGEFVSFITTAGLLSRPIRQLTQVNSVIQRGLAAAASVFAVLDEPPEANTGTFTSGRVEGRIEFRDVGFSYDGNAEALKNVSFKAEPDQTIALVGRSGSGKSTIARLLARFYACDAGAITLDGVPLADYELGNLRSQLSVVSQNVVLFQGSVAENIAYGEDRFDRRRVERAASDAHAMEFIAGLENGLDTEVGDDAGLLSGGQRQRIAIARALLKDAPVLILDEATSALDSESEQQIQEALRLLSRGRTTLVIAHRLSTIENADRIIVLEAGKVVESGTHAELLAKNGHYARLRALQFSDS